MGDRHSFSATVRLEGPGVFVEVPLDVPSIFGRKRAPVWGAVNGTPFQSTVAVYGDRYFLPLNRALRERARVASGDEVSIVLELDETERRVEVPEDFASPSGTPTSRVFSTVCPTAISGPTSRRSKEPNEPPSANVESKRPWS